MLLDVIGIIVLLASGLATGVAAGLFGIGGGTVLIPLLLTVFTLAGVEHGIIMHIAVATSLALIIPTGLVSSIKHYKNNNLDLALARRWIPSVCVGVIVGVLMLHVMPTVWLKIFFTGYLFLCFVYSFLHQASELNNESGPPRVVASVSSFIVGFLSTLLGIGGGTFTTPILGYFHYPIKRAFAISALTGLFIGLIGAVAIILTSLSVIILPPFSIGYVNWLVFLLIAPTAMIGAPIGVAWEEKLKQSTLTKAYAGFLLLMFFLMLYHLLR